MLQDAENLFSNAQAITATANSTNFINMGHTKDWGPGHDIEVAVSIVENFNNLTSLEVKIQSDDNSSFSSARDHEKYSLALADLVAGQRISLKPQQRMERYWRLVYTVTGTNPAAGKITAGVTVHTPRSYHNT